MPATVSDAPTPRLLPSLTDADRPFWTGGANGELLILFCPDCRRWVHPPGAACTACGGPLEVRPASGKGSVFTFTVNRHPFVPAVPLPYVVAVVELAEQAGLRLFTNVVGCEPEDVTIGMPVHVRFEPYGQIYVPVFEPDAAPQTDAVPGAAP